MSVPDIVNRSGDTSVWQIECVRMEISGKWVPGAMSNLLIPNEDDDMQRLK